MSVRHRKGCSRFLHSRIRDIYWFSRTGSRWRKFDVWSAPDWPCVYVIFILGKLSYVGETRNLKSRIFAHRHKGMLAGDVDLESVHIKAKISRRFGDWATDEVRLIERLRPPMNLKGVTVN